ncbi:MAG TPA: penicillin-binding protein 2 [Microbacteriaceae bacterium]|nr:penicillin-binding protein 2 [Microbacteriaceae bacterium]HQX35858.1 penicillin-binding protein 2 [Microbacteriaceae bacterium]HQZ47343.1 penicillin-binding protein 2 [Microbacteriaceae bacterium]HRA09049.1 penicillin-binding protein 2 [Microbacteriaceae bacterium]
MSTTSHRTPRRRSAVALILVLAVLGAFVVRLVDIQVVNADEHVADSMNLGFASSRVLWGERGSIVDQGGAVLAGSTVFYDAELDPSLVDAVKRTGEDGKKVEVSWNDISAEIAAITGQTPEEVQAIVANAKAANPNGQWASLKKGLDVDQYRALADLRVPYMFFSRHPDRSYPDGAVAGNLVGFVGAEGEAQEGLELGMDACLAASDGKETFARGNNGETIPGTLKTSPAVNGGTLQLTINRDLQWYLQQLIAEETQNMRAISGTVTVVEVETGKIRAAAEYPTVDPNNVDGAHPDDRSSRIFRHQFEPGSTFKAVTAASIMDGGSATPLSTVNAPSSFKFPNGAKVNDAMGHAPLNYTLAGALIDSSNVALSMFGDMVEPAVRYDYMQRFGVGAPTAVGFPGEASGTLHDVAKWDNQSRYATTFGQAFTVTAPQVAGAYQAIANGGLKMPLRLVESCTRPDGTVVEPDLPKPEQIISEKVADDTALMVENVMAQGQLQKALAIPGYRVAAKTGTAEVAIPGGYKAGVYFTSLAGFAPADDPKYVVVVTLEEPTAIRSSAATAPAFQKAMTQVLKTYRVLPSSSETPLLPRYQ